MGVKWNANERYTTCMMGGKRAPGLAAGEHLIVFEKAGEHATINILVRCRAALRPDQVDIIIEEFEIGK